MKKKNIIMAGILTNTVIFPTVMVDALDNDKIDKQNINTKNEEFVEIEDKALKDIIISKLGKSPESNITKNEMESIDVLEIYSDDIKSLSGIEKATNLKELHIVSNFEGDLLNPIKSLKKLEILNIKCSNITTISALKELTSLKELTIKLGDKINDLSDLQTLSNLKSLILSIPNEKSTINLSFINRLIKLEYLQIDSPSTTIDYKCINNSSLPLKNVMFKDFKSFNDITFFNNFRALESINIEGTNVSDLSTINALPNLESLNISKTNVSELNGLSKFENLKLLKASYMKGTKIKNISELATLSNLENIDLSGNNISDINPLVNLSNLKQIYLRENSIKEVPTLSKLTLLELLDLSACQLESTKNIENLPNLFALLIHSNRLNDIDYLNNLPSLERLYISDNNIKDISKLEEFKSIAYLVVHSNYIEDISVIENLPNLKSFDSYNNRIYDNSSIKKNPTIHSVSVGGNILKIKGRISGNKVIIKNPLYEMDGSLVQNISLNNTNATLSIDNDNIVIENIEPNENILIGEFVNKGFASEGIGSVLMNSTIIFDLSEMSEDNDIDINFTVDNKEWTNKPFKLFVSAFSKTENIKSIQYIHPYYKTYPKPTDTMILEANNAFTSNPEIFTANQKDYTFLVETESGKTFEKTITLSNIDNDKPFVQIGEIKDNNGDKFYNVYAKDTLSGVKELTLPNGEVVTLKDGETEINYNYYPSSNENSMTFKVSDNAGNEITKSIQVSPDDYFVTINCDDLTLNVGNDYNYLEGVTAIDSLGNDLTDDIRIESNNVKTSIPGNYTTVYSVTKNGISYYKTRNITVKGTIVEEPPIDENEYSITINAKDLILDFGANYSKLQEVSAIDSLGNNLNEHIVIEKDDVNTSKPGEYVSIYSVTYNGVTVYESRNVTVKEPTSTPPEIEEDEQYSITINAKDLELNVGDEYDELQEISAVDSLGNNLTDKIVIESSNVDTSKEGEYTTVYSVTHNGIVVYVSINVSVTFKAEEGADIPVTLPDDVPVDTTDTPTTLPDDVITEEYTINIDFEDLIIFLGDDFNKLQGIKVTDNGGNDLTNKVIIKSDNVDTSKVGEYEIVYSVTNDGVTTTKTRKVSVVKKNSAPTINVSNKNICIGDEFNPLKYVTAYDEEDGDLTNSIKIIYNNVDLSKVGEYTIKYFVADKDGLSTTEEIVVKVYSNEYRPVLNVKAEININKGATFNPYEYITAIDKTDGDISKNIKIVSNDVLPYKTGSYSITYQVENSLGFIATKTVKVNVIDKTTSNNNNSNGNNNQNNSNQSNSSNSNASTSKPQTSDELIDYALATVVSLSGLVVLNKKKKKNNN